MPAVISVKGIRRLIDGITDHVTETVKKLVKALADTPERGSFEVGGELKMDGKFYQEKDGEVSFDGDVGLEGVVPISGVPADVGVDLSVGLEHGWRYGGKGPMQLSYYVKYKSG